MDIPDIREIETRIREKFLEVFDVPIEKSTPDAGIRQDLGLDSLQEIEAVYHIEEMFDIDLDGYYKLKNMPIPKTMEDLYKDVLAVIYYRENPEKVEPAPVAQISEISTTAGHEKPEQTTEQNPEHAKVNPLKKAIQSFLLGRYYLRGWHGAFVTTRATRNH